MTKKPTRRQFLHLSAGLGSAWSLAGFSAQGKEGVPTPAGPVEKGSGMRLSLSVRVAEAFDSKERSMMSIEELIQLAHSIGYQALCMRASQVGIHSPARRVREVSRKIREAGLSVSMVTGDFAVPRNDDQGPDGLRHITPYLDLAQALGSDLIRICMKKEEDLEWARRACDEAREREIRLAHQSHCASLFETVEGSLRVLQAVARPNFGIIYEPANWMIAGEPYGRDTIRRLAPYIFNVYVQNHRLNPQGEAAVTTWKRGVVRLDHLGMWEPGGVDFEEVFAALHEIGYRGYVTVHQAFGDVMPIETAVRKSYAYLKPLTAGPQS